MVWSPPKYSIVPVPAVKVPRLTTVIAFPIRNKPPLVKFRDPVFDALLPTRNVPLMVNVDPEPNVTVPVAVVTDATDPN